MALRPKRSFVKAARWPEPLFSDHTWIYTLLARDHMLIEQQGHGTATSGRLPATHLLLAVAVMFVWGTNFVVIKIALLTIPPLLFALLRFTFVFFPAAMFMRRPDVPWKDLAAYGALTGGGQFGVLFLAMNGHISPGLASLVIQCQIFFTVAIAVAVDGASHTATAALSLPPSCS